MSYFDLEIKKRGKKKNFKTNKKILESSAYLYYHDSGASDGAAATSSFTFKGSSFSFSPESPSEAVEKGEDASDMDHRVTNRRALEVRRPE